VRAAIAEPRLAALPQRHLAVDQTDRHAEGRREKALDFRALRRRVDLAGEMPGMVNDVYRLSVDRSGVRSLQTGLSGDVVAKDRTRKLPFKLDNPTMPLIHQYWSGALVKSAEDTNKPTGNLKIGKKI